MELKDKIILITGSSSGIGKATAIRFAKEGSNIIINYNVNKKGAEEALKEIEKVGAKSIAIKADISNPKEVLEMFKKVKKIYGKVDILINNGGIVRDIVPYLEAPHESIAELVHTDLIGAMICSQEAVKLMQKQGSGKILNTSSIRGAEYGGNAVVYAAAKAGINSFTKTLAKIVAPNIQVNAVAPGFVKTRIYDSMSIDQTQSLIDQTYLERWVTIYEIADAFVFLARNDAMTGQILYVDAGFTLK